MKDGDVLGAFGEPGLHVRADLDEQTQRRSRISGEIVIDHLDDTKHKIKHGRGIDRYRRSLLRG